MENTNEPKPSIGDTVDKFMDNLEGEQRQESSPVTEQTVESQEGGSDPLKTPSTENPDSFKGVDKGFANHPKWIERETKLKETEAERQELSRLLDDPATLKRYLEQKGYSPNEIRQEFQARGMQVETPKETQKDIIQSVCTKLGWDINNLNPNQKSQMKEYVDLIGAVFDEQVKSYLDTRLKPLEETIGNSRMEKEINASVESAMSISKEEFKEEYEKDPDYWDNVIEPAMNLALEEHDKNPANRRIPMDAQTLYEKATRKILKERTIAVARQDDRNARKANARPLTPGSTVPAEKSLKGKNVGETIDKFFEASGYRG